jgi:O-methyltransferase involved in polyketide biosynthesis
MTDKISVNLGNVQKTLLLPLWGRAVETRKPHPMLNDPAAVRILERVDYDCTPLAANLDELTRLAWIKRSLFCDRAVGKFLAKYPHGTVVNLGCGLETSFERCDNGLVHWYDLDLPDVIDLRRQLIPEAPRCTFIATSFLAPDWLDQIVVSENVLFIAAGVFYYFKEQEIKDFVLRLLSCFPGCELLFDVCSPTGMRVANKKVVESSGLDERSHLTWGLKDKKDLLAWDGRIQLLGAYHYFRDTHLGLRNLLMGTFSDILGIQYMLHLRLGNKA